MKIRTHTSADWIEMVTEQSYQEWHASELRQRVSEASRVFVEWATVPIAGGRPGEYMKPAGSGVLLQIADFHFLLTAAHVMRTTCDRKEIPLVCFPYKTELPAPLIFERAVGSDNNSFDVAAILLPKPLHTKLAEHYRFLRLSSVWSPQEELPEYPRFLLTGFAGARERKGWEGGRTIEPWRFTTEFYRGRARVPDYEPLEHFVLSYPHEITIGDNNTGYNIDPPGMSGCGIWTIMQPEAIIGWGAQNLRLAAILSSWNEDAQYVVGVKVSVLLEMLWQGFPEIRRPLQMFGITY